MTTNQTCSHGSLRRQCLVCERDDEIAGLRAKLEQAEQLAAAQAREAKLRGDVQAMANQMEKEGFCLQYEGQGAPPQMFLTTKEWLDRQELVAAAMKWVAAPGSTDALERLMNQAVVASGYEGDSWAIVREAMNREGEK